MAPPKDKTKWATGFPGGTGSGTSPVVTVRPQGPLLTKITIFYDKTPIIVGKEYQFAVMGDVSDKTYHLVKSGVVWDSDNKKVVVIDPNTGLATITGAGSALVTAQVDDAGTIFKDAFNLKTEGVYSFELLPGDGTVHYFADEKEWVLPRLETAKKAYADAESLDTRIGETLDQLAGVRKRIKSDAEIKDEISKNAKDEVIQQARTAENALGTLKISNHDLDDLQNRLSNAKVEVHAINDKVKAAGQQDEAAGLRKTGEQQEKELDEAIEAGRVFVKAVSEISSGHPPMEAEYDGLVLLFKIFHENKLLKQAEELETEARKLNMKAEADLYALAKKNLKDLSDLVEGLKPDVEQFEKTYKRDRDEVEKSFDGDNANAKGVFRFDDVVKAINLAALASRLAKQNQGAAYTAKMAAYALSVMDKLPPDGWKPADRPEAERVLRGMAGDGERMFKEAIEHLKDTNTVLMKLKETYKTAQNTLVNLPPRAKKK